MSLLRSSTIRSDRLMPPLPIVSLDFLAYDRHVARSLDSQPNAAPGHADDCDGDLIPHEDPLANLSTEH